MHAVVAGQVARRLRRRHQVVRRQRELAVRQRHVHQPRPEPLEHLQRFADRRPRLRVERVAEVLPRHAHRQRRDRLLDGAPVRGHRPVDAGAVAAVVSGDHLQEQRRVGDRVRERADLVERAGEGDQAVTRNPAVRRLQADDAAEPGRLADRAAGVGAEGEGHLAGRDGRRRAAAGAAGDSIEVPRVARHLEGTVLGGRAHGELVHVRLADQHRVRAAQAPDDVRVVWRHKSCKDLAAASGAPAAGAKDVFEGDRHARQRAERFAPAAAGVDLPRLRQRALHVDRKERLHERVAAADGVEEPGGEVFRGELVGGERAEEVGSRSVGERGGHGGSDRLPLKLFARARACPAKSS